MEMYIPKSFRQIVAMLLCLAMLVPMVPVRGFAAETAGTGESADTTATESPEAPAVVADETDASTQSSDVEYVSLPIIIRDFAADGMLFEFNQTAKYSETYFTREAYDFLPASMESDFSWSTNGYLDFRIRPYSVFQDELPHAHEWWYCVICNSDGSIKKVLPAGTNSKCVVDENDNIVENYYAQYMTEGCFSVWLWIADGKTEEDENQYKTYKAFEQLVNEDTKHRYRITYDQSSGILNLQMQYVEVAGRKYIVGDNDVFTLLATDTSDYINNLTLDNTNPSIEGTQVVRNDGTGDPTEVVLNSSAPQTVYGGNMRLNLVAPRLDDEKKPVYTEATVTYLAEVLSVLLDKEPVPYSLTRDGETYYTGYYILGTKLFDENYQYVGHESTDAVYDLADVLRRYVNGGMGNYSDSKTRFEQNQLRVAQDAATYFDAAYYLLHMLWRDYDTEYHKGDDGYGWNTWEYTKINLVQRVNANGRKSYVFNSGYDDTVYDYRRVDGEQYVGSGAIYNTQTETITPAQHKADDGTYTGGDVYSNGVVLPNARFDPLGVSGSGQSFGYGMDAGTYCKMLESYPERGELFYPETNYHLSLEGHAKFIYYKDNDQYFTFTGDDDVYLYVNNVRVLDLGGAHAIARVTINLNDVAELCGLSDGMTYDFDFYYLERHGTAANFGIETNIQIVDPSMTTTKTGYQDGEETGYNGLIHSQKPMVYEFALENNGEDAIQNLTFRDDTIGTFLSKDQITLNSETEIRDLSLTLTNQDGSIVSQVGIGALTEEKLKEYLTNGLEVGQKITIYGFTHTIRDDQWDFRFVDANGDGQWNEGETRYPDYFYNIVYTSATSTSDNSSTRELTGVSHWVVYREEEETELPQAPDNSVHTDKYVSATDDPNQFVLNLEAYVEGESNVITKTTPADIVLVLDQSASMYSPAGGEADYTNKNLVGELSSSVAVEDLDPTKAQHMGYYVAQSIGGRDEKDENGVITNYKDWFVVQYINGKWYYVRKAKTAEPAKLDPNYSGSTNLIGATLVRDTPIDNFNYYQSGYGALYDAVHSFVDGVKASGVDHRIAVVGFASPCYDAMEFYDGSGVYVNGEYYLYDAEYPQDDNGVYTYVKGDPATKVYLTADQISALKTDAAKDVYDEALVSISSGYNSIKASLNAVTTNYWHTCPAAGLDMANQIFAASSAAGRDRIVILFTDGVPTVRIGAEYGQSKNWTDVDSDGIHPADYWTVAQGKDNAIKQAFITKNTYNAELYTVGTAAVEDQLFLNAVSSDYPNATYYPTTFTNDNGEQQSFADDDYTRQPTTEEITAGMGDAIADPRYTHFASASMNLETIFHTILETTTTVTANLDANSELRDVLSDYFELQSGDVQDISVYTVDYLGNGVFSDELILFADADVEIKDTDGNGHVETVSVTGFDYAANNIHEAAGNEPAGGKKLVVQIRIKTREGFWGGNNVPTNAEDTGLYPDEETSPIKLPEPQVNVPLELTIQAKDAVIYYGSDVYYKDLLESVTAGGLPVNIDENGNLTPQADWMDDYATLVWTEGKGQPGDPVSNTDPGDYTCSVTLKPNTNGIGNTESNPSNIVGNAVAMAGMTVEDSGHVDILIPVIPFEDSTITLGEVPGKNYFNTNDLVDEEIRWVLIDDISTTKAATQGQPPVLDFTYEPVGTMNGDDLYYESDTKVNVTVTGTYGTNDPIDLNGIAYYEWKTCTENLHQSEQTPIEQHKADAANQHEFWIHVTAAPGSGLNTDKYVTATENANEFILTLEAFARGQTESIDVTKPADIVLVLDHSGSMRTPVGAPEVLYSGTLYTGGGEIPRSQISVEKAKHRGYYVAQSTATNSWFIMEFDTDFMLENGTTAERWVGYLVPSTESIVDTTGNYTEHEKTLSWVPGSVDSNLVFYKSQYAVLYDAMLEFVGELKASGVEHNVAIIGFAGSEGDGTRLYVGSEGTGNAGYKTYRSALYHNNTTQERREELYRMAMKNIQSETEYAELLSNIELIETNHSFTCPTAGLQLANEVFAANAVNLAERDRIVVLFTDGIPNRQMGEDEGIEVDEAKQNAIYDEIVKKAYETKNTYQAQVYSICTTTVAGNRAFLDYSSSNYPDTSDYAAPGTQVNNQYFHEINDFETLTNVFTQIHENTTTTSVTLDETAILKEVLTDYFVLNPDDEVDVTVYTAAYNGDGTFADKQLFSDAQVKLSSTEGTGEQARIDTIEVSGFDYREEYVSSVARQDADGNSYYGSKLIVEVRVRTRDGFWGGNNVPTNEAETGIYSEEGTPVEDFPEPQVNVPIDVTVDAVDKTIYYNGSIDSADEDTYEGDELINGVTIGGMDVTVNNDGTFTPQESWMDDFANANWAEDSTKPDSDLSNTEPKDYTYTVVVTPTTDGSQNTSDNPSNIAGNIDGGAVEDTPSATTGDTASDTGHVYILVPELTFKDSTTDFGTPAQGYDYTGMDYVSTEWVFMEDTKDTANAPAASGTAPELTLTYTPDTTGENSLEDGAFVTDTKVNVSVAIKDSGENITGLTNFVWQDDCEHADGSMDIAKHPGLNEDGEDPSHEFWVHVTLNIVPDTVVIDYGLDVVIDVLSNDPRLGTTIVPALTGIGVQNATAFGTDDVANTDGFGKLKMEKNAQGENVKVRYALNTSNGMQMNREEVFAYQATYTIKGEPVARSSTVTVIPATTIYYEDEFVEFTVWQYGDESNDYANVLTANDWSTVGSTGNETQKEDRPGKLNANDADNIYGYDSTYANMMTYSLGSAKMVSVDDATYAEAQFTFYGTGFDIISLTSNTTGTILVDVFKTSEFINEDGTKNYTATPVASQIVDTYYGYQYTLCNVTYLCTGFEENGEPIWERSVISVATGATEESPAVKTENPAEGDKVTGIEYGWIVDSGATNALYQVPVIKVNGLDYNRYTALITVFYMSSGDHQNDPDDTTDDTYDFYLDAIRIYDPADDGAGSETIKGAYVADGEGWPEYFELRNQIISKTDFDGITDGEQTNGVIFIDNTVDTKQDEDGKYNTSYTISDYTNYGPNNELYLAPGQSVAFQLNVPKDVETKADGTTVEHDPGIHLALKTVGNGTAEIAVYNADKGVESNVLIVPDETTTDWYYDVKTATDLYYDISSLNGKVVVITNSSTSGTILSITNIKVTHAVQHTDVGFAPSDYFTINKSVAEVAMLSLRQMTAPETEEPETTEPETTEPETTEPETTEPETTEPETTEPETTEPETTEPEITEPEVFTPDKFTVSVSDSTPLKGSAVKVTVTTSADVDYIMVNGKKITKYSTSWYSGNRNWSTWITAGEAGEMEVAVICYNAEDLASEPVTKTLTVSEKGLLDKIWDLIGGWWKP